MTISFMQSKLIKTLLLTAVLLALPLLAAACASSPKEDAPLWSDENTLEQAYPSSSYIARIGRASSAQAAESFADSELTRHFEHSVQSVTSASQVMVNNASGTSKEEKSLERKVFVDSSMKLFALHHTQAWFEKKTKTYVVCSYLNREEAFSIYENQIKISRQNFEAFYNKAQDENNYLKKISALKDCIPAADSYLSVLSFAHTLYPKSDANYEKDKETLTSIDSQIAQLKKSILFYMDIKGDSNNQIKDCLTNIFTKSGFTITETKSPYIIKVLVDSDKTYHEETITANPKVSLQILGQNTPFYSITITGSRVSGFKQAEAFVNKKIFDSLVSELKTQLPSELENKLF